MPETRIAFGDANWLFALYYETGASDHVRRWASLGPSTLVVSSAVLAECRCNFWRAGNRISVLESDIRARRLIDCGYTFEALAESARESFRLYAPRCNIGTLDVLHVHAARQFGCRWFLIRCFKWLSLSPLFSSYASFLKSLPKIVEFWTPCAASAEHRRYGNSPAFRKMHVRLSPFV